MSREKVNVQEELAAAMNGTKDNKGNDMYTHMQKLIVHLALTDPRNALTKIEEVSYDLRTKDKFEASECYHDYRGHAQAAQPWYTKVREKFFEVRLLVPPNVGRSRRQPKIPERETHRPKPHRCATCRIWWMTTGCSSGPA